MLGWGLTWAAAELNMLQRLLSTVSLTDPQWVLVLALSVVAPLVVGVDNAVRIRRLRESEPAGDSGASTVGSGV